VDLTGSSENQPLTSRVRVKLLYHDHDDAHAQYVDIPYSIDFVSFGCFYSIYIIKAELLAVDHACISTTPSSLLPTLVIEPSPQQS